MLLNLQNLDAVKWLASIKDNSIDLMLLDPAYQSLDKHRAIGTTTRLANWFPTIKNSDFEHLFAEFYRVQKMNTHLYIMCDQETAFAIKPIGEAAGFKFHKALIWDKTSIGMGYHYRSQHEFILFFEKGKRRLNNLGIPDVLRCERVRGSYPTQKPVKLLSIIIEQSSEKGQLVADPFMGSGSSGEAALRLGRRFIGTDISETAYSISKAKLERYLPKNEAQSE